MKSKVFLIACQLIVLVSPTYGTEAAGDPTFAPCLIKAKDEVEIPAQKEGVLTELTVIEGSTVAAGAKIAVIDDREARAAVEVAEFALNAATEKAKDNIEARFAAKSAEVAEVDLKRVRDANARVAGSVPDIDVSQAELMFEKSTLQIEKAEKDQFLALLDAKTKKAELGAAKVALEKRSINAPFAGEVVKLLREKSEWVNPGDPILKLMRFDILYAEARVPVSQFDREDLVGKAVTVTVERARGQEISLPGKIVYVGQMLESGRKFLVRAEVQNVKEGSSWAMQPSVSPSGKMTIHLK